MSRAAFMMLAWLAFIPVVHADEAARAAREHYEAGRRYSARGDWPAAMNEFAAGYALSQKPAFLFNMGECARAMGDPMRARASYERYLAAEPDGPLAARARARLATLPQAEPAPPPGQLLVIQRPEQPRPRPRAPRLGPVSQAAEEAVIPLVIDTSIETQPVHADSRSVWKSPWLWTGVGVLVAGSITAYALTRDGGGCTHCLDFR